MRYLPHTQQEIEQMLAAIGVPTVDALFDTIPAESRLGRPLALEPGLDEVSLMRHLSDLAAGNQGATMLSFQGAGIYDHHIPPAVDQLLRVDLARIRVRSDRLVKQRLRELRFIALVVPVLAVAENVHPHVLAVTLPEAVSYTHLTLPTIYSV